MRFAKHFDKDLYSKWHRKYDGIAMIDVDSIEVCPKCYEPLAILETCYEKGQQYKATTLVSTLANRLQIPSFLVFYKDIGQGSLAFRIKRLWLSNAKYEVMTEDEWVNILYEIQEEHKDCCINATPHNI
jgi:hypothetical protein